MKLFKVEILLTEKQYDELAEGKSRNQLQADFIREISGDIDDVTDVTCQILDSKLSHLSHLIPPKSK